MKKSIVGVLLLFIAVSAQSQVEWPHYDYNTGVIIGKEIPRISNVQFKTHIPDGKGGFWLLFPDISVQFTDTIHSIHIDKKGTLTFADGKARKVVGENPRYISDGQGGIIIAVMEYDAGVQKNILKCHRLNEAGQAVWGNGGSTIDNVNNIGFEFTIVESKGAYYAATVNPSGRLFVQKFNTAGIPQWQQGGIAASQSKGMALFINNLKMTVGTYEDGVDVVWNRSDTLFVQRYSSTGARSTTEATPIVNFVNANYTISNILRLQNKDAWYIAWSDIRYGANSGHDIYMIRYGNVVEGVGDSGRVICRTTGSQYDPILAEDGQGGVLIAWRDYRSGQQGAPQIYGQRLLSSGVLHWTANGVQISSNTSSFVNLQVLPPVVRNSDFYYIIAEDQTGIYAQKLNSTGQPQWFNTIGRIHSRKNTYLYDRMVLENGEIICLFTGESIGILEAKLLDRNGYLGENGPRLAGSKDVINDQGGRISVALNASWQEMNPPPNQFSNNYYYRIYRGISGNNVPEGTTIIRPGELSGSTVQQGALLDLTDAPATGQQIYWEQMAEFAPLGVNGYSKVVASTADSGRQGIPWNYFMASYGNTSSYPQVVWYSNIDSGYSVDNLPPYPPQMPAGTTASGAVLLHWKRNTEADLAGYEVYRGPSSNFTPDEQHRIAVTGDTLYRDQTAPQFTQQYYIIKAVDVNGNRSNNSSVIPMQVLNVSSIPAALPTEYALDQNYPNPFNPSTNISFALPAAGMVTLTVTDALGREAGVLVQGYREAGRYTIPFSASHLASGVYFCEIRAEKFSKRIKMNLVK